MGSYIKGGMQAKSIENRTTRRVSGPKRDVNEGGEGFTTRNFIVYTVHLI
jgi:hypothetical protein